MRVDSVNIFLIISVCVVSFSDCDKLPLVDTTECSVKPTCNPNAKYRTIDGSCSNSQHNVWGQANRPFVRAAPATYLDGQSKLRRSVEDAPLPLVRTISSTVHNNNSVVDQVHTLNVMQWGQLIAHDVTLTSLNLTREPGKRCCTADNKLPPMDDIPANCLPVEVASDDQFYHKFGVNCLDFSRASSATRNTCFKYPIEQVNTVTSVLDASMVYGSDRITAKKLRTFSNGQLRVLVTEDGRHFLPSESATTIPCPFSHICYFSGDIRVNQNTDITVYQILLVRLHNSLCKKLKKINPVWNDERLYQEARRIVWAFIQHVTYSHFLPIILGNSYMRNRSLSLDKAGENCRIHFDPSVNPSTYSEFAGSAYRSLHSLVPRKIMFVDEEYKINSHINLDDYYFQPYYLQQPKVLDMCLRGLVTQPQDAQDLHVSSSLRNLLFKGKKQWGNDLESIDIMRGRDLGLPTYNRMRQICGLNRAVTFKDFLDEMNEENINKLKTMYLSVDDVDLFVGATLEKLLPGSLVGFTNQCIIGEQFNNYMRGDRFFYRNCGLPWSFTKGQLQAITQTSTAWLFCAMGDDISAMPADTFRKPSQSNPIIPCRMIKGLDLSSWEE